jgi:type II secretory pathway component PulF
MSPLQAFEALRASATPVVESELGKVQQPLQAGSTVPQALSSASALFSKADLAVLTAYNDIGALPAGFQALAAHANDLLAMRQAFYRGLRYPLFVIVLATIVMPLPQLVLRGAESYLVLIGTRLGVLSLSLLLLIWGLKRLVLVPSIGARLKSMAWRAPWPATVWTNHVRSVFHRTLAQNVDAGLELWKAITSATASTNDPSLASRAVPVIKTVTEAGLTKPLIALGLVRQTDAIVLISGEQSGALVESLSTLAARYKAARDQGLRWVNRLVTLVASIVVVTVVSLGVLDTYKGITGRTNSILEALGSGAELDNLDLEEVRALELDSLLLPVIERGSRSEVNRGGSRR